MRTEMKLAVVVVLVIVIGAVSYFFKNGNEEQIKFTTPTRTLPPKVLHETSLPDVSPVVQETPTTKPALQTDNQTKALVKIDLDTPSTKPVKVQLVDSAADNLTPNKPAKIELATVAEPTPVQTTPQVHVVKTGETLFSLAQKYYGRGEMWTIIARANHQVNPDSMRAGTKLTIPAANKAKTTYDGKEATVDTTKHKTYKVKSGDSFYLIAQQQLGTGARWKEIFDLNKSKIGKDPKNIKVGQTIILPKK